MTRKEHLLVLLMEECAELAHITSKTLRFGAQVNASDGAVTNAQHMKLELNDILAVVKLLESEDIVLGADPAMQLAKMKKVEQYIQYSKRGGR